jgi:hypothetical protein
MLSKKSYVKAVRKRTFFDLAGFPVRPLVDALGIDSHDVQQGTQRPMNGQRNPLDK